MCVVCEEEVWAFVGATLTTRILRAFFIEEQKIVKKVFKAQQLLAKK